MTSALIYVNSVMNQLECANDTAYHTISCDVCTEWEIAGNNDLYRLKCGDGWLLRHMLDEITTMVENPGQFVA